MRAIVLGSAAGGGFPQWNCGCGNCAAVRACRPGFIPRTQDSVALVHESRAVLLNASPDVAVQIARCPALWPGGRRHTPIGAVVLTNGDLDHVLGLFSLREAQPLAVYATRAVWSGLEQSVFLRTLRRFEGQLVARELRLEQRVRLADAAGDPLGIELVAVAHPGKRPIHLDGVSGPEDNVGVVASGGGRRLAYVPGSAEARAVEADVLLFDGTFFTDDELLRRGLGGHTAHAMAHVPIEHSVALAAPRKIYTHINNSNPILDPGSDERRLVEHAGWEVASDGLEIEL